MKTQGTQLENVFLGTAKRAKKNIHACQIWDERKTRLSTEIATSSCPTSDRPGLQMLKHELNKLIRKMTAR